MFLVKRNGKEFSIEEHENYESLENSKQAGNTLYYAFDDAKALLDEFRSASRQIGFNLGLGEKSTEYDKGIVNVIQSKLLELLERN